MSLTQNHQTWRKSSRSQNNGGCVEVACIHDNRWRKSTRSTNSGGNCLEIAAASDAVAIRDSKLPTTGDFPTLSLSTSDWAGLLAELRH